MHALTAEGCVCVCGIGRAGEEKEKKDVNERGRKSQRGEKEK